MFLIILRTCYRFFFPDEKQRCYTSRTAALFSVTRFPGVGGGAKEKCATFCVSAAGLIRAPADTSIEPDARYCHLKVPVETPQECNTLVVWLPNLVPDNSNNTVTSNGNKHFSGYFMAFTHFFDVLKSHNSNIYRASGRRSSCHPFYIHFTAVSHLC